MRSPILFAALVLVGCVDVIDGAPCQTNADCPGALCSAGRCVSDNGVQLTPSITLVPPGGNGPLYLTPGATVCLAFNATNSGTATSAPPVGQVTSATPGVTISGGDTISFSAPLAPGDSATGRGPGTEDCGTQVELDVAASVVTGTAVELDLSLGGNNGLFATTVSEPVQALLVEASWQSYGNGGNCWIATLQNLGPTTVSYSSAVLTSPTAGVQVMGGDLGTFNAGQTLQPQQSVMMDGSGCQTTPLVDLGSSVTFFELDLTVETATGQVVLPSGYTVGTCSPCTCDDGSCPDVEGHCDDGTNCS